MAPLFTKFSAIQRANQTGPLTWAPAPRPGGCPHLRLVGQVAMLWASRSWGAAGAAAFAEGGCSSGEIASTHVSWYCLWLFDFSLVWKFRNTHLLSGSINRMKRREASRPLALRLSCVQRDGWFPWLWALFLSLLPSVDGFYPGLLCVRPRRRTHRGRGG